MRLVIVALALAALPRTAPAQHTHSPYAAHQDREIKALSEEEVDGLLSGEGMGFALAAELNGYPGPRHVIELAAVLELSGEQLGETRMIFAAMQERARALGRELVDLEAELDREFADARIDRAELSRMRERIGLVRAALREAHLAAHLEMADLLSDEQRMRYRELRGYKAPGR